MPLHDDYKSEKNLKELALGLAPALTQILNEEEHERFGFILFVCDIKEGLMQYISDCDPHESLKTVKLWCARRELDLANANTKDTNNSSGL